MTLAQPLARCAYSSSNCERCASEAKPSGTQSGRSCPQHGDGLRAVSLPSLPPQYCCYAILERMDAEGGESVTLGHGSLRSTGKRQAGGSGWMILVGIGLFLWVGLPLLNLAKMAIESAFSDEPVLGETSR